MKKIFEETQMNHMRLKNRLFRSATWDGLTAEDGTIPEAQFAIYRELAEGGVGAILTAATSVQDHGIPSSELLPKADALGVEILPGFLQLHSDWQIEGFRRLAEDAHANDARILPQLMMDTFVEDGEIVEPDAMTEAQIGKVIRLFTDAAVRAEKAGCDGVQLHAAHWFFLNRFIAPNHNHRTDGWGGDQKKRTRIVCEIIRSIREAAPSLHIGAKVNAVFETGGMGWELSRESCVYLAEAGIDHIEVSSDHASRKGIRPHQNEGTFRDYAADLQKLVACPVISVCGYRSVEEIEKTLNEYGLDYVSLSRPLIREPDLPKRWASGDTAPAKCISCSGCFDTEGARCIFNVKK